VTTIEGLYIVNDKNDFRFHHGRRGSNVPHMKEIRTEYMRLEHRLDTITALGILICNAQNLGAYVVDIMTDTVAAVRVPSAH
jgi:hypothetical protein